MAVRDKIAGEAEAIHDKIAEEAVGFLAEQPIEATLDNTVDPFIELVVLAADRVEETDEDTIDKIARSEAVRDNTAGERVGELTVDTSIEDILVAEERGDDFSVDPLIEAIQSRETTDKEAEGPRFKSSQSALRHTIVYRLSEFDEFEFGQRI